MSFLEITPRRRFHTGGHSSAVVHRCSDDAAHSHVVRIAQQDDSEPAPNAAVTYRSVVCLSALALYSCCLLP